MSVLNCSSNSTNSFLLSFKKSTLLSLKSSSTKTLPCSNLSLYSFIKTLMSCISFNVSTPLKDKASEDKSVKSIKLDIILR